MFVVIKVVHLGDNSPGRCILREERPEVINLVNQGLAFRFCFL